MQKEVYERLCSFQGVSGELPNLSDLAREIGITYMTLQQHLKALAKKGYLLFESRGRGRSPTVRLIRLGVPVLGNITAGSLSERLEEPNGYLSISGVHYQDSFALCIEGDSMSDLIQHGDMVLLQKRLPSRSGEICALRVYGETTLKYLDWDGSNPQNEAILRPHNRDYPSIAVPIEDIEIDGVYQGLLRGEPVQAFYQEVN